MIFAEYASPIPGSAFSSCSLAELISTRPVVAAAADFEAPPFAGAFFGACGAAANANATIRIQTYFANRIAPSRLHCTQAKLERLPLPQRHWDVLRLAAAIHQQKWSVIARLL